VFVEDSDIERLAVIRPLARRAPAASDLTFALREPSIRHSHSPSPRSRGGLRASSTDILLLTTSVVMVNN
jgi:hypothetical protein